VLAQLKSNDELYVPLLDAGLRAIRIGDCKAVRNLRSAVTEGAHAGLTLDRDLMLNANAVLIARQPTEVAAAAHP
jgi:hypothetical protein